MSPRTASGKCDLKKKKISSLGNQPTIVQQTSSRGKVTEYCPVLSSVEEVCYDIYLTMKLLHNTLRQQKSACLDIIYYNISKNDQSLHSLSVYLFSSFYTDLIFFCSFIFSRVLDLKQQWRFYRMESVVNFMNVFHIKASGLSVTLSLVLIFLGLLYW